jgi:hypothetical protein
VRKTVVGQALSWLKQYNEEYKHINIDMQALDWLKGNKGVLEAFELDKGNEVHVMDGTREVKNTDLGPNPNLT